MHISSRTILTGFAATCALALSGAAFAADSAQAAATNESNLIDSALRHVASDLTSELDDSTRQRHEAQRLHQSSEVANRYGIASRIDNTIETSADEANALLVRAKERDDYTMARRQLLSTQSLYYPGSKEYQRFDQQIRDLDRRFAEQEHSERSSIPERLATTRR